MRIAFLTNSLLSLESAAYLHQQGILNTVATIEKNVLLSEQALRFCLHAGIEHVPICKENLASSLLSLIERGSIDIVIVQTFPYKIPESCLNLAGTDFYNIHPAPLPQYRGPDPVFWLLKNNEQQSAITLHRMDVEFDTGPIILSESIPVYETDTYGTLNSQLAHSAPVLLRKFLSALSASGPLPIKPQNPEEACFHKKPDARDLLIDWSGQTARQIEALCRACNPNQNGSIAFFREVITRILEAKAIEPAFEANLKPGTVITADPARGLQVKTSDNKALLLNILHTDEGYFSGTQFIEVFQVKIGEKFTPPSFVS